jgi:hypothetical protein
MEYEDYAGLNGAQNKTGFNSEILMAPKSWFADIKVPVEPFTNPGDSKRITDDHTFNAGKGWVSIMTTLDTQELTGEPIGDNADSMGQKVDFSVFLAGLKAETTEIAESLQSDQVVLLIRDCNLAAGEYIQLGCDCDGLMCKSSPTGGKKSGGAKGYTLAFTGYCGIQYYSGAVTLKP